MSEWKYSLAIVLMAAASSVACCTGAHSSHQVDAIAASASSRTLGPSAEISMADKRAIAAARQAVGDSMNIPADAVIHVTRSGRQIVVTFELRHPPVIGADYIAQVTLDATTLQAQRVQVGS